MCLYSEKERKNKCAFDVCKRNLWNAIWDSIVAAKHSAPEIFIFSDWLIDLNEISYVYLMLHLNFGPLQRQQLHEKCVGYANLWNAH